MTPLRQPRLGEISWLGRWCACAVTVGLWLLLYRRVGDGWWMADDTQHLLSVFRHGIAPHFAVPHESLGLIPANLTPLLFLSYGVDHAIGGLNPSFAYWHHLIAWVVTTAALTYVLCAVVGIGATFIALVLWLVSVPVGVVAQLLCTRHYLEGLLFAVLAIAVYRSEFRQARGRKLAVLTALCAVAMSAKEIYVPLAVCLFAHRWEREMAQKASGSGMGLLPASLQGLRAASRQLWPLIGLSVLYVFWRSHMLGAGRLLSGYGASGPTTTVEAIQSFPRLWSSTIHGDDTSGMLAFLLVASAVVKWLRQHGPGRAFGVLASRAVWVACIAFPALMVVSGIQENPHYLFLPSLVWFIALGWAIQYWWFIGGSAATQWVTRLALCISLALLLHAQWQSHGRLWLWSDRAYAQQHRVEGEQALYGKAATLIVDAAGPPWHHLALQDMQREIFHKQSITLLCAGPSCKELPQSALSGLACRAFDRGTRLLQPVACPIPSGP